MASWWINNSGLNMLKGVDGDESNPIRLTDAEIVDFLRQIPASRQSFEVLVPRMLPLERERLEAIAAGPAFLAAGDPKLINDAFQSGQNKVGVYTTGRRGGTRRGGNN